MKEKTTWSPRASSLTPSPTSSTMPAPSWPSTSGSGSAIVPVIADRSEWHTPQAPRRTNTSPRFGPSTLICSTWTGLLCSRQRTALALRDIACASIAGGLELLADVAQQPECHPREQQHARHQRGPQQPFPEVAALGEMACIAQRLAQGRRLRATRDRAHLRRAGDERAAVGPLRQYRSHGQGAGLRLVIAVSERERRHAARSEHQLMRQPADLELHFAGAEAAAFLVHLQHPIAVGAERCSDIWIDHVADEPVGDGGAQGPPVVVDALPGLQLDLRHGVELRQVQADAVYRKVA